MQSLRVTVPGSTSNLGPGFDCLGLALDLSLEVTLQGPAEGASHQFTDLEGEARSWPGALSAGAEPCNEGQNTFLDAFDRALEHFGAPPQACAFAVKSTIPVGRGMGSSGAAVAAGLTLGAALAERHEGELLNRDLIALGAELEGHPDNSTASLLGGCTLALRSEGNWHILQPPVAESIGIALAWGNTSLSTAKARRALPEAVPFAQAADQPRRLAFLLEGLRSGDGDLLALGGVDHLHEAVRLPLIPGAGTALQAAREAGAWLATLSGAGAGLLALAPQDKAGEVALAMGTVLEKADGPSKSHVAQVGREPANVTAT